MLNLLTCVVLHAFHTLNVFLIADVSYHVPVSLIFEASKIGKYVCRSTKLRMEMTHACVHVD